MKARPLFIGGTSSNAGKSWMVTAVCAWLRSQGVSVAPFKAQNMSNNSYPCKAGGEIGRAQVAQAEACGLDPEPAMNPILLKPSGNSVSQVVVLGRMWKTLSAREYYACADVLRAKVLEAYDELASRFEVVVIEGAGSVSEVNLRAHDLVNLRLATALKTPWLLVADIERGGVFGSIVGTTQLLTAEERALYRGFMINKLRGDVSLFDDAVPTLETLTASRCFGVFPYANEIHLDAEDSLALDTRPRTVPPPHARIAIIRLPYLSNATDFRLLTWAEWLTAPGSERFDYVILPGTKNTIADLEWLRATGMAGWAESQHRHGATIIGICGGYQMLGAEVIDPTGVEGSNRRVDGLRIIPASTVLTREKRTRAITGTLSSGQTFAAYEIHLGATTLELSAPAAPFATLADGSADGFRSDRVIGTYLHGAFEDAAVCRAVFRVAPADVGLKSDHYRRLGLWFEHHQRHMGELHLV